MPVDFIEENAAIDFQEEAPPIDFRPEEASLTDFLSAPDTTLTESSPLTTLAPLSAAAASTVTAPPKSELDFITAQIPAGDVPLEIGAPARVGRFGAPGTITRGVSDTLGGLVEWALNKPEEALATLTPLAPAIAARYAPEIALQFGKDVTAGVKGDKEAIGRALSMAALVGGPKVFEKARASYLTEGEAAVAPERPVDVATQLAQPIAPRVEPLEPPPADLRIPFEPRSVRALEGAKTELTQATQAAAETARASVAQSEPATLGELAKRAESESAPTLTGMGGATPAEFANPPQVTATKNAVASTERSALNLPPAFEPVRRSFPEVWEEAKARIDADPAAQDKLLADLRATPRAVTDTENALLLHRKTDLRNDYNKNARELEQAVDDGRLEDVATRVAIRDDLSSRLLDVYDVLKKAGTETSRGLNARKMVVDQDFDLASMVTERRAVNDGRPLSPRQQLETQQAQSDIVRAQRKRDARPSVENEFELDRAKRRWNEKLANDADANASTPVRALQRAANALNDVRTIVTAYDLSAFLRQGKIAMVTHPFKWASAIPSSLRAALSPLNAFKIDHEITTRPNAQSGLYARSSLYLAEAGRKLTGQEEAYLTRGWARHVPGIKASERAYTTFLNKVRADLFDSFVATLSRDGKSVTLPEAKVLANYVNVVTGRGDLAKFNAAGNAMATIFFAPRYVASRFQYLLGQPLYYGALSGKVRFAEGARARKLVAFEYGRALLGLSLLYGTYAMFADSQNFDKYSSDFLKLRSGNTRIDPFAGLQQATVLLSREIGGKKTTLRGKTQPIRGNVPYGGATAVDVGTQFLRSKLAPVPGAIVDVFQGKNVVGEPTTAGSIASDLLIPITYQEILATLEDQGVPRATALTLLSFFGEGVQTYSGAPKRTK